MINTQVHDDGLETIRFCSSIAAVGRLRCPAGSAYFRGEQQTGNFVVAFPRAPLWIRQDRGRAFVASSALATMYNRGQRFERRAITTDGDTADWFAVDERVAREAVAQFDRAAAESASPLRFDQTAISPPLYRAQQMAARRSLDGDQAATEEAVIGTFADVVRAAYSTHGPCAAAPTSGSARSRRARAELVERVKSEVGASYRENLGLGEIAKRCEASVYHLCRTFRAQTGNTIHGFRRDLRLRASLAILADAPESLSALAQRLGFSSHSHFTAAFRRQFGVAPAQWVRAML